MSNTFQELNSILNDIEATINNMPNDIPDLDFGFPTDEEISTFSDRIGDILRS